MGFWHLLLVGGVIAWTACVFLRAVATRTFQLRGELVPTQPEEPETDATAEAAEVVAAPVEPHLAQVMARPQNESAPPAYNSKGANGKHSGNGHAKVPIKRH